MLQSGCPTVARQWPASCMAASHSLGAVDEGQAKQSQDAESNTHAEQEDQARVPRPHRLLPFGLDNVRLVEGLELDLVPKAEILLVHRALLNAADKVHRHAPPRDGRDVPH